MNTIKFNMVIKKLKTNKVTRHRKYDICTFIQSDGFMDKCVHISVKHIKEYKLYFACDKVFAKVLFHKNIHNMYYINFNGFYIVDAFRQHNMIYNLQQMDRFLHENEYNLINDFKEFMNNKHKD